jgi:hypothetical protein
VSLQCRSNANKLSLRSRSATSQQASRRSPSSVGVYVLRLIKRLCPGFGRLSKSAAYLPPPSNPQLPRTPLAARSSSLLTDTISLFPSGAAHRNWQTGHGRTSTIRRGGGHRDAGPFLEEDGVGLTEGENADRDGQQFGRLLKQSPIHRRALGRRRPSFDLALEAGFSGDRPPKSG